MTDNKPKVLPPAPYGATSSLPPKFVNGVNIIDDDYLPQKVEEPQWKIVTNKQIDDWFSKHKNLNPKNKDHRRRAKRAIIKKQRAEMVPRGKDISISSTDAPWQVIYGETRVSGVLTFALASGDGKKILNTVYTIAAHEIDAISNVYVDGIEMVFGEPSDNTVWSIGPRGTDKKKPAEYGRDFYSKVFVSYRTLGGLDQTADPDLITNTLVGGVQYWNENCRQRGFACPYVSFIYDGMTFPNGLPDVDFKIRGKKVYDPRDGGQSQTDPSTWAWSQNPALCIADFTTDTRIGKGIPWAYIDETSLIAAANICDQSVDLKNGGTETRYTLNGSFTLDQDPDQVIKEMETAMAGHVHTFNGKYYFEAGAYYTPVSITLTDDDLRGEVKLEILGDRSEKFNSVKGRITSPVHNYESIDVPPVSVKTYRDQDGGEYVWEEINLPFTQSSTMAQRIQRIKLEHSRRSLVVKAPWSLKAYPLQVGDNVVVDLSRFAFPPDKVFRVVDYGFSVTDSGEMVIDLELKENESGVYFWDPSENEQETHEGADTLLPSITGVEEPTGLTLESGTDCLDRRADGTIFSRLKVSWTAPDDIYVTSGGHIEIQYQKSEASVWRTASTVAGNETWYMILDVQDGEYYNVRIRARNAAGFYSTWVVAYNHRVIGKTAPPTDVSNLSVYPGKSGMVLSWDPVLDLDLKEYRVQSGYVWDSLIPSAQDIGRTNATNFTLTSTSPVEHGFMVKAVDTSGNESVNPASISFTITPPTVTDLNYIISGENVILTWLGVVHTFAVATYEVSYYDDREGTTVTRVVSDCRFTLKAAWSGVKAFSVRARDIYSNLSPTASSIEVEISPVPDVAGFTSQVVDNNVLFYWDAVTPGIKGLPIATYKFYRGPTWAGAAYIGESRSTFFTFFESQGGSYTYWVKAVDTAGNVSVNPTGITITVAQPPDFMFFSSVVFDPEEALTLTNVAVLNNAIYAPVNTSESWQEHFENNSWTSIQDQINAGYPLYIEPGENTATYSQVWTMATAVNRSVTILFNFNATQAGETLVTVTPRISYSMNGVDWTDGPTGVSQITANGFQYVKVTLTFTASGGKAVVKVEHLGVVLSIQEVSDAGRAYAQAGDSGGTVVPFNKSFIDVASITVTPEGTTPLIAIYDFSDVPNPTSFKALLYNTSGTRQTGWFSWTAKGT